MNRPLAQVLVAATIAVAVWLLAGLGWSMLLMGAGLALSLWVMLFAGSYAGRRPPGRVSTRDYAVAGALGTGLGYLMTVIGDGPTWWAVGFIAAGVLLPSALATTERGSHER